MIGALSLAIVLATLAGAAPSPGGDAVSKECSLLRLRPTSLPLPSGSLCSPPPGGTTESLCRAASRLRPHKRRVVTEQARQERWAWSQCGGSLPPSLLPAARGDEIQQLDLPPSADLFLADHPPARIFL